MEKTKKTTKQKIADLKSKTDQKIKNLKASFKAQKQAIIEADRIGYSSGVVDYHSIPKKMGAKISAVNGYKNALKDSDKIYKTKKRMSKKLSEGKKR